MESAWKLHAKQMYEGIEEVDYVQPVMRLVHRTRHLVLKKGEKWPGEF